MKVLVTRLGSVLILIWPTAVSLWGEITGDKEAINPIIHRFTLNTETTQKLGIRDIIFEPSEEPAIGEPLYLRCRKDNTKTSDSWYAFRRSSTSLGLSYTIQVIIHLWQTTTRANCRIIFVSNKGI